MLYDVAHTDVYNVAHDDAVQGCPHWYRQSATKGTHSTRGHSGPYCTQERGVHLERLFGS